jgi:hypothetical protein
VYPDEPVNPDWLILATLGVRRPLAKVVEDTVGVGVKVYFEESRMARDGAEVGGRAGRGSVGGGGGKDERRRGKRTDCGVRIGWI